MNSCNEKNKDTLKSKCPGCTASISFNQIIGKWKCDYCGLEFSNEEMKKHFENENKQETSNETIQNQEKETKYTLYHCNNCGIDIITDKDTSLAFCINCGTNTITKNEYLENFEPEFIIPFKKSKEYALETFKKIKKGKVLMPNIFTSKKIMSTITGVYIPTWLFDIKAIGDLHMLGTKRKVWTTGNHRYIKTDKYKVVRGGEIFYNNIPNQCSMKFDNKVISLLEPYDFKEIVNYDPKYLLNYYSIKPDENTDQLRKEAEKKAINKTIDVLKKITKDYETIKVESNNIKTTEEKKSYALLPVWMINIKYKGKIYLFAMNGQTGKFIYNIPLDTNKIIIYSILIFLIIFITVIAFSYLMSGAWL